LALLCNVRLFTCCHPTVKSQSACSATTIKPKGIHLAIFTWKEFQFTEKISFRDENGFAFLEQLMPAVPGGCQPELAVFNAQCNHEAEFFAVKGAR
jgi:hypothetical protein